jgi:hypothetical protein
VNRSSSCSQAATTASTSRTGRSSPPPASSPAARTMHRLRRPARPRRLRPRNPPAQRQRRHPRPVRPTAAVQQLRRPRRPDGEIVPGAGWIARDPMDVTGARVGSSSTTATARPERTVLCDACAGEGVRHQQRCVYCDGQGRRQLHAFNLHLQPEDDADARPARRRHRPPQQRRPLSRARAGARRDPRPRQQTRPLPLAHRQRHRRAPPP